MNKRFFTAGRLMGAMLCLMLALTALTSCREDDDKDAFRYISVINFSPIAKADITHNSAIITLNIASMEVLGVYEKFNVEVWADGESNNPVYKQEFYSKAPITPVSELGEDGDENGDEEVEEPTYKVISGLSQKIELTDLQPKTTYYYQATAYVTINGQTGEYRTVPLSFTTSSLEEDEEGISEGEFIDLGTGVEWASCNLGAASPEQNQDYYACNDEAVKATLAAAARRLPTEAEVQELVEKCKWTWYEHNGVWGYRVASTVTGKSIFLPAAGIYSEGAVTAIGKQGYYWIDNSDLGEDATTARAFNFSQGWNNMFYEYPIFTGLAVRPVKK